MFHFWFNTFFVRDFEHMHHDGSGRDYREERVLSLTLKKHELDRANKDKAHKLFSPNFEVKLSSLCFDFTEQRKTYHFLKFNINVYQVTASLTY